MNAKIAMRGHLQAQVYNVDDYDAGKIMRMHAFAYHHTTIRES